MRKLHRIWYTLTEHIPAVRWCFALAVIAFTAAVSVCKYIDLGQTAAFSSLEVMFMILTDVMNIVLIYLPLYLFIVCGIMFGRGYGETEILRHKSRAGWLGGKLASYIFNTAVFFAAVLTINYTVCSCAFNSADAWSGDFVGFRVMLGQSPQDFTHAPLPTIAAAAFALFLFYALCGTLNLLVSFAANRESAALLISLLAGTGLGLANMLLAPNDMVSQLIRCAVLLAAGTVIYALCILAVRKKNLGGAKN